MSYANKSNSPEEIKGTGVERLVLSLFSVVGLMLCMSILSGKDQERREELTPC